LIKFLTDGLNGGDKPVRDVSKRSNDKVEREAEKNFMLRHKRMLGLSEDDFVLFKRRKLIEIQKLHLKGRGGQAYDEKSLPRMLFKIVDVKELPERGVEAVSDITDLDLGYRGGDVVELRRPDGVVFRHISFEVRYSLEPLFALANPEYSPPVSRKSTPPVVSVDTASCFLSDKLL